MTGNAPRIAMLDPAAWSPFYDAALCAALARAGAAVELHAAPFALHPWPPPEGYERRDTFPPAGRRKRASRLRAALGYPLAWRRFLGGLDERRPDVVHAQWSPWPRIDRLGFARVRARGIPLALTVHNVEPHGDEPRRLDGFDAVLELADALIVHSQADFETLSRRRPALAGRLSVVPPGIEPPLHALDREEARALLGVAADEPILLFAGLVRRYKGVEVLVEAFERLATRHVTAKLVIAGLPRSGGEAIERARRSPVAARIRLDLAYLERRRYEAWIAAADAVVLPYLRASPSAVVGDAIAAGRPIVASRVDGLREALEPEDEGARLVAPGDAGALAVAIERLLEQPARATAAAQARRAASLAGRRWDAAAAATIELNRGLARASSAGAGAKAEPLPA